MGDCEEVLRLLRHSLASLTIALLALLIKQKEHSPLNNPLSILARLRCSGYIIAKSSKRNGKFAKR